MKKFILTVLFFVVSLSVFSQRIIVFDSNNDTVVKKTGISVQDKNALSWNLGAVLHGAILFEYERKLNDYLHVLGGAGITTVDLYYEFYRMIKDFDDGFFGSGSSAGAGFIGEVALKVFPKQSDDMNGFYLGPLYRFRNYNSKFNFNGGKYRQFSNFHDLALILGWQGTTYSDFFYNAFIGFGYGFGFHKNYEKIYSEIGWNEVIDIRPVSSRQNVFLPVIGIAMGWVF